MERLLENIFLRVFFMVKLSMIYVVMVLSGLFIFGITPANATILYLYQQYRMDISRYHFTESWQYYKKQFRSSNAVFLVLGFAISLITYGTYLLVQLPNQSIFTVMLSVMNTFVSFYLLSIYAIYLKLQVYYEFKLLIAIKLSAIAVFFSIKALAKLLVGTAICIFLLSKVSLMVMVFIPVVWLMFVFDVLDPIYQRVASHYQMKE